MSPLDEKDVAFGISKAGNNYFSKSKMAPGSSVVVKVIGVEKNEKTAYPIKGETFCYRFTLDNGQVWDEASQYGRVIKIVYPDGKTFTPAAVKITKLTTKPAKGSQYQVDKA